MQFFNCSVSGSPIGLVQWLRNGEPLLTEGNGKIKLLDTLTLVVNRVTRHDRGMYQCVVRNDRESAQGSAELRLGGKYSLTELNSLNYTFHTHTCRIYKHIMRFTTTQKHKLFYFPKWGFGFCLFQGRLQSKLINFY